MSKYIEQMHVSGNKYFFENPIFFKNHTCGSAHVTTSSFRSSSCFFEGHVTLCSVCVCVYQIVLTSTLFCDGTDSCWKDRKISCFMTLAQSCFYWQKNIFFIFNLVLPHVTMTIQSILFYSIQSSTRLVSTALSAESEKVSDDNEVQRNSKNSRVRISCALALVSAPDPAFMCLWKIIVVDLTIMWPAC